MLFGHVHGEVAPVPLCAKEKIPSILISQSPWRGRTKNKLGCGSVLRQKRIKTKIQMGNGKIGLAIDGGAGTIDPRKITPQIESDLRAGLQRALDAGQEILREGGSSLDAVIASVRVMEDDPLFNAGRGAVFTRAGRHEM